MGAHAPDTAPDLRAKRPHTVAPRYWMGCHNPEPHDVITQAKSPVREFRTPGSARGVRSNAHPYRDKGVDTRKQHFSAAC